MMLVLHGLKKDGGSVLLALHIGLGASVYAVVLALLYAPVLKGLLSRRARPA
jgi:hypothetical protein